MLTPRHYQQEAHDAVIASWKQSTQPVAVEAATGSGKSVIVAMLAKSLFDLSGGKRVLCLAPSAELIEQNAEKYRLIGEQCSIYSASISKNLRHQVVFATEGTFKKVAKRLGHQFAGVIIDECHRITNTVKNIVSDMQEGSPNLRVAGLSATPYRLGDGFIFGIGPDDKALPPEIARDPYFYKCVYSIGARYLVDQGFLTPLRAGDINAATYDTSGLKVQSNGQYNAKTVSAAFEGWGRETAGIVADVVGQTQSARGVMIFAATVRHAEEIMASLHPDNARMIGGKVNTSKADRKSLVSDFKAQKYRYLVSVGTMTTGVDFTHVDYIAIMRATESVSLLQQIMGRGMRLHDGKHECVVLDYAGNFDKHMPDGDLYKPEIKAAYQGESVPIECRCPECSRVNLFGARPNPDELPFDEEGYFLDLTGERIMVEANEEKKPMPAHFGRRCQHTNRKGERCDYYWSSKVCDVCEHHNDIAARYCANCKSEIINPNDKLIRLHKKHKKDPTQRQCDELLEMDYRHGLSRAGNDMITVDIVTSRRKFTIYLLEHNDFLARRKMAFMQWTKSLTVKPRTVSYVKKNEFWEVLSFDEPTDDELLQRRIAS